MKCIRCGAELREPVRGAWPYRSLPGTLLEGVWLRECPSCGEVEVEIPRIEELDRLLARLVASRPGRLTGPEIRFLRKHLGWSGVDFAAFFQTDRSTVSRWESGAQTMDVRAEQLLRVSATRLEPIRDYAEYEQFLGQVAHTGGPPDHWAVRWAGEGWEAIDVAA